VNEEEEDVETAELEITTTFLSLTSQLQDCEEEADATMSGLDISATLPLDSFLSDDPLTLALSPIPGENAATNGRLTQPPTSTLTHTPQSSLPVPRLPIG
jgi:hypothetical protein